jgi:hypothetical protein
VRERITAEVEVPQLAQRADGVGQRRQHVVPKVQLAELRE